MAKKKKEKPKNVYEQAREAAEKITGYSQVLQQIQQGKFVPNLSEIAYNAAMEAEGKVLKADAEVNLETSNTQQLFDYIQGAAQKFSVRTDRLFKEKLEDIIDKTPDKAMEGIEKRLYAYAPPEDKKVPKKYKDIAKLHRQAAKIHSVLTQYKDADNDTKRSLREDVMYFDIQQYYEELYKDGKNDNEKEENAGLLNASIKWMTRNPELCERKYAWLLGRKVEEFNAKLLGLTYEKYKKLKDEEKDERETEEREIDKEREDEDYDSEFLEEQKKKKYKDKLKDKLVKEVPDYLKEVMQPETIRSMYMSYWQEEAAKKARQGQNSR